MSPEDSRGAGQPESSKSPHAVFISYSSEDQAIAEALCTAIEAEGIGCWIAPRNVKAGRPYSGQITQAIREARVLLLVLSVASNRSKHVLREVERAAHCQSAILTFRIEPVPPGDDLAYFVGADHWVDGFRPMPPIQHFRALIRQAKELIETSGDTTPEENPAATVPPQMYAHFQVLRRPDGSLFRLGKGGMGVTYKAIDTLLNRPVALKVIAPELLRSPQAKHRFLREARAAAMIQHPHVATIHQFGEEGDDCFYAMEFVEGEDLDRYVSRQGPLQPATVLRIALQVAQALEAAQARQLIHRDIKPGNIMAVAHRSGALNVKLIDFGLAKGAEVESLDISRVTRTQDLVGAPAFASPEQCDLKKLDTRSDIYSLGITLWFLLAGKTPFSGSVREVMNAQVDRSPPFDQLGQVPEPVVELIRRMLEKNPDERFQTPEELQEAIEGAATQLAAQFAAVAERISPKPESDALSSKKQDAVEPVITAPALDQHLVSYYRLERDPAGAYLVREWVQGFLLYDLLRWRRSLKGSELPPLLDPLAGVVDFVAGQGLGLVDVSVRKILVACPHGARAYESVARRDPKEWSLCTLKLNPLSLAPLLFKSRNGWDRQTIVPSSRVLSMTQAEAGIRGSRGVRLYGRLVYELLSGRSSPRANDPNRYVPLPELGQVGNAILHRACTGGDGDYRSCQELWRVLKENLVGQRRSPIPTPPSEEPEQTPPPLALDAQPRSTRPRPSNRPPIRWNIPLAILAGAAIIGLAIFATTRWGNAPGPLPTPSPAPSPLVTATPVPSPLVTATPVPSPLVTATPVPSPLVTATPVPSPLVTATPVPSPLVTATPVPSPLVTATPVPSPLVTATPTSTVTPARDALEDATKEQPWENSLGMKFVPVPGTKVLFSIWDTRVRDFSAFVEATNYDATGAMWSVGNEGPKQYGATWRNPGFSQGPTHPVVGVSWNDAKAFCKWLTEREHVNGRLRQDKIYRLPTDVEWSIAIGLSKESGISPEAKDSKITGVYPWGKQWPPPAGAGNFAGEEVRTGNLPLALWIKGYKDGWPRTSPVGSFRANRFGLFDMSGNVSQWCEDWYLGDRVVRGGAWNAWDPSQLLSSRRIGLSTDYRTDYCGFRCVVELASSQ